MALPSERRRTIDYLRRKARSIELQAARAAPVVAAQLKSLAESMQVEAEERERVVAIQSNKHYRAETFSFSDCLFP